MSQTHSRKAPVHSLIFRSADNTSRFEPETMTSTMILLRVPIVSDFQGPHSDFDEQQIGIPDQLH
jgi:hypothetical protein